MNDKMYNKAIPLNNVDVFVMDLLCMTPYYDRYLIEALSKKDPAIVLGSISFHLDPGYYERYGIKRLRIVDLVAKWKIDSKSLRQALKLIEYAVNLAALSAAMIFKRPKIIHVQWIPLITRTGLELWFLKLAQSLGVKIVYTVHNTLPHDTGLTYKEIFKNVYCKMDALICHTHQIKDELIHDYAMPADKLWVIPHGPMLHDAVITSKKMAKETLRFRNDQSLVLTFGVIRPYKGIESLLNAWRDVVAVNKNALLIIAGNGEPQYVETIKNLITLLGLGDYVRQYFRFVPETELHLHIQAADILVYPYKTVSQSGALLTGMAFGKPIVATALAGFKETLGYGKAGILVEPGNTKDLADALVELIKSPEECARLGAAALSELQEKYSWDSIADKTLACYRRVLSQ